MDAKYEEIFMKDILLKIYIEIKTHDLLVKYLLTIC